MTPALSLEQIRVALGQHMAELDADALTGPAAARLLRTWGQIRKLSEGAEMLLAPRVDETGAWRGDGHHSTADWLAAQSGSSVRDAAEVLKTGKRLEGLLQTEMAIRAGELSADQARIVSEAAEASPASERALLDLTARETFQHVKAEGQRIKAATLDPVLQKQRIHRERTVRHWIDDEGAGNLLMRGHPKDTAMAYELLKPLEEQVFREGRRAGTRERFENRKYDAFVRLLERLREIGLDGDASAVTGAAGASGDSGGSRGAKRKKVPKGANTKAILLIDHAAWARGYALPGETVEVAGLGPIPVEVAREMMQDAVLAAVIKKGQEVVAVTHLGRGPNALQRTALEATRIECTSITCNRTVAIEIDHRVPYNEDPITAFENLDPLCTEEHRLKTHHGWALEPGTGRRRFLPPEHPDHPNNRGPDPARAGPVKPAHPASAPDRAPGGSAKVLQPQLC